MDPQGNQAQRLCIPLHCLYIERESREIEPPVN